MFKIDYNNFKMPEISTISQAIKPAGFQKEFSDYANQIFSLNEEAVRKKEAANQSIAANLIIDPEDPKKVYAVGLAAIKNVEGRVSDDEILAFQEAYQELMVNHLMEQSRNDSENKVIRIEKKENFKNDLFSDDSLSRLSTIIEDPLENDLAMKAVQEWFYKALSFDKSDKKAQMGAIRELDDILSCPISGEIFENPVRCEDKHTYEDKDIKKWLKDHPTSPITRQKIDHSPIENRELKMVVKWFNDRKPEQLRLT